MNKPDRICPKCDGLGIIPKTDNDRKKEQIEQLISEGFSYEYIADLMGIKSTSTIHYYTKRK